MTTDLARSERTELTPLEQAGQAADNAMASMVFAEYRGRRAANTLRRQAADLSLFARFLASVNVPCGDLQNDPEAWRGVTGGLVKSFAAWQLRAGYAIASINGRLSTVRVYASLATQAGAIPPGKLVLIRSVNGYEHSEQKHLDDKRQAAGQDIRRGAKKSQAVTLTPGQALAMRSQPNTPQGRRDNLLIALMVNLGLRVGEVAILTVECFDLAAGMLLVDRPKVDKVQTHRLDAATLEAARAYLANDAPAAGVIWRVSAKGRGLGKQGMSERAITKRVYFLGKRAGVAGLSAHDLRHFWATQAARNGTALDRLQDAGGWASLAMPGRYIAAAAIANDGIKLG